MGGEALAAAAMLARHPRRRKAAIMTMTAATAEGLLESPTAAVAATTATATATTKRLWLSATTAVAAATAMAAAAAALLVLLPTTAALAMPAAGLRISRARNRQSGDARSEEEPGHGKISFRTGKERLAEPHRSNT